MEAETVEQAKLDPPDTLPPASNPLPTEAVASIWDDPVAVDCAERAAPPFWSSRFSRNDLTPSKGDDLLVAVSACENAIKKFPGSAELNFLLGFSYSTMGRTDDAVEHLEFSAESGYISAQTLLGMLYLSANDVTTDNEKRGMIT